jgi:hypothetical protein
MRFVLQGAEGDGSHAIDDQDKDGSLREKWNNVFCKSGLYGLRPSQAAALEAASLISEYDGTGLFTSMAVGDGKTLLLLLITQLYPDVERALLLLDPKLVPEFEEENAKWRPHFHLMTPQLMTYSRFSHKESTAALRDYNPDLIMADECQALKNAKSARGLRFFRYMKENPNTRFIATTGTIEDKCISEYTHLLRLSLGPLNWLPRHKAEMNRWVSVLSNDGEPAKEDVDIWRPLAEFYGEKWPASEASRIEAARRAYRERLSTCPGVLMTSESSCTEPLTYHIVRDPVPEALAAELGKMMTGYKLPNGDEIVDAAEMTRHRRTMAVGFYNRWDWDAVDADDEWLLARNEWSRQVRAYLSSHAREGCDSPALVEAWVENNQPRNGLTEALKAWNAVRHLKKPPTIPVWVNYAVLQNPVRWLNAPGKATRILWYYSPAVGDALEMLGCRVNRKLPKPSARRMPRVCLPFTAFHRGQNLQDYDEHRLIEPTPNGARLEQWGGRGHRGGRKGAVELFVDGRTHKQLETVETAVERSWGAANRNRQKRKMFLECTTWANPTPRIREIIRRSPASVLENQPCL